MTVCSVCVRGASVCAVHGVGVTLWVQMVRVRCGCGHVSMLYISTHFKVRELAASTLSGLVHCGFVRNLPILKVRAVSGGRREGC